jgi:hypothetical protein
VVKWLERLVGTREQRDQLREQWDQLREQWSQLPGQLRGQWSEAGLVKAPRVLKPMDERVVDAFDDETRDKFGLKYLEVALDRWSEITATVRRTLNNVDGSMLTSQKDIPRRDPTLKANSAMR